MTDKRTDPLADIRAQLAAASSRAQQVVEGLNPALLARRPDQDSWSVAECIHHLTLTTDAYVPSIRQAIEEGRRKHLLKRSTRFRMGFMARMLDWWLEPPYRMRSRTGAAFVPRVQNPENVLEEFLARQGQLAALLSEAEGLALDRLVIASPFAKQMRYNVYAAFRLIATHQRRHLWQAERTARKLLI